MYGKSSKNQFLKKMEIDCTIILNYEYMKRFKFVVERHFEA